MAPLPEKVHVLVVGGGNAGFAAALSASQSGVTRVLVIDKCPEDWAGGNTYFTAGAYRTVHNGLKDLLPLVNNLSKEQARTIDMDPYTPANFKADLDRVCMGRSDPGLARTLIEDSRSVIQWLAGIGIRFQLSFNRQAYKVDGRTRFWGGLALMTQDHGKGLIEDYLAAARRASVTVAYSTAFSSIEHDQDTGRSTVTVLHHGQKRHIRVGAVIFAAGGFESNPRMRTQFLGPGWDMAMVRGTPYNTGDCLEALLRDLLARPAGNWSGCHATAWDANANPHVGDREASNEHTKSGYPLGLMLNVEGRRFVDEGIDLRNFTYAKFGRAILHQPEHIAFQVWDARTTPWLRDEEYREGRTERITANTLEGLADKCVERGLHRGSKEDFIRTIKEYNDAVYTHRRENPNVKWDPAVKDGLSTQSSAKQLPLAKSNWALPIDKGPFLAVKVTCGVTFTFGGLEVTPNEGQLVSAVTGEPIRGVYCVGEMMGGVFYSNYPGGSGLTSGAVFGRRAGRAAAAAVSRGTTASRL